MLCYNVKRKARDDLPSLVVWPQPTTEKMGKTGAHIKKRRKGNRKTHLAYRADVQVRKLEGQRHDLTHHPPR